MESIQLEFQLDDANSLAVQFRYMKKQLDDMQESMRKQTKKLFGECRNLEKRIKELESENVSLKEEKAEKIEWIFCQDDQLVQCK